MPNAYPERPIDREQLTKDAVSVIQQLFSAWDGEVDIVVMLLPRGRAVQEAVISRSIESNDAYRAILTQALKDVSGQKDIKNIRGPG